MDQRRVLRASCHQWDASFFGVVAQLVEAWVCNPDGTAAVERVDSLQRLVGELDQLFRPLSSRLRGAINAGNTKIPLETTQDVFTDGLVEAIARLLRSSLALVVIEDVQWMDEASRRVLRRVVDTADYPVLFLVTARSDLDESVQAQRFLGALQPIAVWDHQLEALSVAQSSELAAQHLRVLPLASEHAYALGVLGDGTPLGVLEVIRFVLDAGLLVPDWESWKLDVARVAELRLPTETVQLIGQRIRRLTSDAVEVLQIAAILGIRFEASLLRTVGDASLSRILAVLVDAQRCELIEAVDANRYRFVHQSICDALTSGWDSARLQMIHARALKALCEESGNDLEQLDSERVFRAAHHASLAQGHAPRSLVHAALSEAGKRAFDSFDNARALGLLSRADALAPGEYHGRGNYLLAEVYLRLGDLPSSLERFRVLVAKQESAEQRAQVWSRICWIHESEFDSEAAWAALGQAFACHFRNRGFRSR
jgi:predicted ATPase